MFFHNFTRRWTEIEKPRNRDINFAFREYWRVIHCLCRHELIQRLLHIFSTTTMKRREYSSEPMSSVHFKPLEQLNMNFYFLQFIYQKIQKTLIHLVSTFILHRLFRHDMPTCLYLFMYTSLCLYFTYCIQIILISSHRRQHFA
jgi:hypothetical protein